MWTAANTSRPRPVKTTNPVRAQAFFVVDLSSRSMIEMVVGVGKESTHAAMLLPDVSIVGCNKSSRTSMLVL